MNAKELEIFLETLGIRQYRSEIISQYIESPLRFGVGFREFMLMNLIVPTLFVGPTLKPVPGGALVTSAGVPKYPGATFNAIDVMNMNNRRSQSLEDFDSEGAEVFPQGVNNGNWAALSVNDALIGGALTFDLVGAEAGLFGEVLITHISFLPVDDVALLKYTMAPTAPAGGVVGMTEANFLTYRNDDTNLLYDHKPEISFPRGWKYKNGAVNNDLQLNISGGSGVEDVTINFYYRYLTS